MAKLPNATCFGRRLTERHSLVDAGESSGGDTEAGAAASGAKTLLHSPDSVRADFARAIRVTCLQRRELSLEQLAALSGVSLKRLRRLIANDPDDVRYPSLAEALSIWGVLGAAAANASLARIGLVSEAGDSESDRLTHAVAEMFASGAELARITADGAIEPHEVEAAIRAAERVSDKAVVLKSAARKARRKP